MHHEYIVGVGVSYARVCEMESRIATLEAQLAEREARVAELEKALSLIRANAGPRGPVRAIAGAALNPQPPSAEEGE